jgi:hypothetical protein
MRHEGYIQGDIDEAVKTYLPRRWMRKMMAASMLLSNDMGLLETTVLPARRKFSYEKPFILEGTLEDHQQRMRALLDGTAQDMKFVYDPHRDLFVFENNRTIPLERCLTHEEKSLLVSEPSTRS